MEVVVGVACKQQDWVLAEHVDWDVQKVLGQLAVGLLGEVPMEKQNSPSLHQLNWQLKVERIRAACSLHRRTLNQGMDSILGFSGAASLELGNVLDHHPDWER